MTKKFSLRATGTARALLLLVSMTLASCGPKPQAGVANEPSASPSADRSASSSPAAYVGTWGTDLAQCRNGQELESAPMVLSLTGYDQHEIHCSFDTIEQSGQSAWRANAKCDVEGDQQTITMDLAISDGALTLSDGGARPRRLVRCLEK
ncbi:MAG: hypothetical protein ABUL43_02805 [Hyphomicrobium sp.]